jgi:hypothetical protein
VAATPDGAEQVAMVESALGAELEELVSWIGVGALAIGWDGSEPYAGAVIVPTDVAAATRRFDQLATFAGLASLDPSIGVSVAERDVAGTAVTTIRWQAPAAGELDPMLPVPAALAIELAVTDDRALIGIGERFVERVLGLGDGESLADEPRYRDAVADLGGASNAGVAWVDLAGTRTAIEEAAGPMLDEAGVGATYESDVRPWLLPLDRLVQVTVVDGERLVQRSVLLVGD